MSEMRFAADKNKIMAMLGDHEHHESLELGTLGCKDLKGALMSLIKDGKQISCETSAVAGFRYRLTEEERPPIQ